MQLNKFSDLANSFTASPTNITQSVRSSFVPELVPSVQYKKAGSMPGDNQGALGSQ